MSAGVPFISDAQLQASLERSGADSASSEAALDANAAAQIDGLKAALAILALIGLTGLGFMPRIPTAQPGSTRRPPDSGD